MRLFSGQLFGEKTNGTQQKKIIDFITTIVLLLLVASVAVIGINLVMEPFTTYDFKGLDEASKRMLLQIYRILKNTRFIIIIMLVISVAVKSFQFVKGKELQ